MRRTLFGLTSVLLTLWLTASGCGNRAGDASAKATVTTPSPAYAADTLGSTESSAVPLREPARSSALDHNDPMFETVLAPRYDVELFARLDGQIVSVSRDVGERVAKGEVLARFDDREWRAVLEEREAEVARMESAWERGQRLYAERVISDREFIDVRSDWQVAKARRDLAAVEHELCTVTAPISGVIAQRGVQAGQSVKEEDLMFRVSDPDRLRAELLLPEVYLGQLKRGHRVRLIPLIGGEGVDAQVTRVSPIVDPGTGAVRVMIDFDNRHALVPAGMTVRVEFDPPLVAP